MLLDEAGLKPNAKWLLAEGADSAAMTRSIPLAKALDDCLVAYRMNGEMLRPEQGYPVRLVVPGWEGNIWVKWLRRLEVGDKPWYRARGDVEIHRPDGRRQSAPVHLRDGREVGHHRAVAAGAAAAQGLHGDLRARLVRARQDRARRRLARRRPQLARGEDRRAACSTRRGALLRRDRLGRRGNAAAVARDRRDRLRAADQGELRKIRGVNSIYHNNGIQTWHGAARAARSRMSKCRKSAVGAVRRRLHSPRSPIAEEQDRRALARRRARSCPGRSAARPPCATAHLAADASG